MSLGDHSLDVSAGKSATTAAQKITLTVGASSITIEPASITIASPQISINGDAQVGVSAPMTEVKGDRHARVEWRSRHNQLIGRDKSNLASTYYHLCWVVLRVISAVDPGRRVQIRSDQILKVGRSGWADLCVASDEKLRDIHFHVRCGPEGCLVESLDKQAPTLVNGDPVTTAVVYDGDLIQAGSTKFAVTIEGGPEKPIEVPPEEEETANTDSAAPAAAAAAMGLVGVCAYLEFADDIQPLAVEFEDGDQLIEQLEVKRKFQDAIRLRGVPHGQTPGRMVGVPVPE